MGPDKDESARMADRLVIVARGPADIAEPAGVWVLADDDSGVAEELAAELAARNQTVVLAHSGEGSDGKSEGGRFRDSQDVRRDRKSEIPGGLCSRACPKARRSRVWYTWLR